MSANPAALRRHVREVRACRRCPTVVGPPVIHDAVPGARLLLVGQAPGPREGGRGRPFAHTAGQRLFAWTASIGADEETFRARVWIAAVLRCFPGRAPAGGDRVPAPAEIATCRPFLEREIRLLRPATVIAVGSLAIEQFLPPAPLAERVGEVFAGSAAGHRFELVPLPHPSGRSTWANQPANRERLERALERLRTSQGWVETFGATSIPP